MRTKDLTYTESMIKYCSLTFYMSVNELGLGAHEVNVEAFPVNPLVVEKPVVADMNADYFAIYFKQFEGLGYDADEIMAFVALPENRRFLEAFSKETRTKVFSTLAELSFDGLGSCPF